MWYEIEWFYRCYNTLNREDFERRQKICYNFFNPVIPPLRLTSAGVKRFPDSVLEALAVREEDNLVGKVLVNFLCRFVTKCTCNLFYRVLYFCVVTIIKEMKFRHTLITETGSKHRTGKRFSEERKNLCPKEVIWIFSIGELILPFQKIP